MSEAVEDLTRRQKLAELSELIEWLESRPDPRGAALVSWAREQIVYERGQGDYD